MFLWANMYEIFKHWLDGHIFSVSQSFIENTWVLRVTLGVI